MGHGVTRRPVGRPGGYDPASAGSENRCAAGQTGETEKVSLVLSVKMPPRLPGVSLP